MADTDLTFFSNKPGCTLLDRFIHLLKDVRFFDILVGYFRSSGFFRLYKSFEHIEKIRILVGLNLIERNLPDQFFKGNLRDDEGFKTSPEK